MSTATSVSSGWENTAGTDKDTKGDSFAWVYGVVLIILQAVFILCLWWFQECGRPGRLNVGRGGIEHKSKSQYSTIGGRRKNKIPQKRNLCVRQMGGPGKSASERASSVNGETENAARGVCSSVLGEKQSTAAGTTS